MKQALLLCAVLLAGPALAQVPTHVCLTGGTQGGTYSSCPKITCGIPPDLSTLTRTIVGGKQQWQPWSTIPPSGSVIACTAAGEKWSTKAASGIVVTPAPPPPPSQPPPTAPPVGTGDALTWATAVSITPVTSYRVYVGTASGVYAPPVDVGLARRYEYPAAPGTYYFVVTALNASGESAFSAEVSKTVRPPSVFRCATADLTVTCTYSP